MAAYFLSNYTLALVLGAERQMNSSIETASSSCRASTFSMLKLLRMKLLTSKKNTHHAQRQLSKLPLHECMYRFVKTP
jgi:hypothetical protein